jgi:hypothetical protein
MQSKTIWKFFVLTFSLTILTANSIFAQSTGSLSGTVTDQTGAFVQGATVTVKNASTNLTRTVITNDEGRWSVQVLPVGKYTITYEKQNFKKAVSENVEVEASVPRTVDVSLEVGGIETVVSITADQPLVQTETATVARQISGEEVVKLPTSTRSFTGLLSSEAGVSSELSPVGVNGNGNISPSVNGTRTTSTSFIFNGIDATNISTNEGSLSDNISPAPETLQEVKLQTSLYDASTGRSGGGNFQVVTKSGGNTINGSAYLYLQNKALNANDFFFNKFEIEKPKADRLETGGTFGGAFVKDKFFYFIGYQYTNANTGFVTTARSFTVLPRALTLLSGERTATNVAAAFNQFNGCTVGTNCLTANDISPVALRLLNLRNPVTGGFVIPVPNSSARLIGVDRAGARAFQFGTVATGGVVSRTLQENNQLLQQLNVEPSKFKQNQLTLRLDGNLTQNDVVSGTFFWAKFPGIDSFPDPSSLASPFSLKRNDQNNTLATSYTKTFSANWINQFRFGYFFLNNTRSLDDPFLEITSESVGISNPAILFDDSIATRRLGHFIGRPGTNMAQFSFGGPNDSFNKRKTTIFSVADGVTWLYKGHNIRFGGDFKSTQYDTNLPEEQATEFEKFDSFTQLITGNATEADTQFGVTDKSFRMRDFGFYITDDWKPFRKLALNFGLRYELFMWPTEKNGRIGNFDFSSFASCFTQSGGTNVLCDNPTRGFIVPNNAQPTGLGNVDTAIAAATKVSNNHTLNGQDKNNFAPRFGLAYSVTDRLVFRGGYGLFYDRPSAAFINTVFSNYPFLREVEITVPSGNVPIANAFSSQPTNLGLNNWLPFRVVRGSGATGTYVIRDNTGVGVDPRGQSTGSALGNIAETFEFRAVDRNLKTPLVQQWNVGLQYELTQNLMIEARYVGTKGKNLLQAVAFNQGFDLNDPNTPDHIFERFNQAYLAAGAPNGALNAGSTARERGLGRAFGFLNTTTGRIDNNLANASGAVINFEARVPILGFNVPEALLLESNAYSDYHGGQFSLTRRFTNGLQFNISYTFSKSIDNNSSDPGSTAGSGKPDTPNTGFVVQGDQRNLEANKAVSDFDRTHRFSTNFVWDIPTFGSNNAFVKGWQISGFFQAQSGTPYTIFSPEPEIATASQYTNLVRGSGGLFRLGFGRPNICPGATLSQLGQTGSDITEQAFNSSVLCSPLGGIGNLGRNTLRSPSQKRFDLGLVKTSRINERMSFEIGWDIFNVFNTANFATPDSELGSPDFGKITNTVGGPRIMQFRARIKF